MSLENELRHAINQQTAATRELIKLMRSFQQQQFKFDELRARWSLSARELMACLQAHRATICGTGKSAAVPLDDVLRIDESIEKFKRGVA